MEENIILKELAADLSVETILKFKESAIQIYVKYVNEIDELIKKDKTLKNSPAFIDKRCELTRAVKVLYGSYGLL